MPSHTQISSILPFCGYFQSKLAPAAIVDCTLQITGIPRVTANLHQLIELHLAVPHIFSKVHSLRLDMPNIVICMEWDPLNQNSSKCLKQILPPPARYRQFA